MMSEKCTQTTNQLTNEGLNTMELFTIYYHDTTDGETGSEVVVSDHYPTTTEARHYLRYNLIADADTKDDDIEVDVLRFTTANIDPTRENYYKVTVEEL